MGHAKESVAKELADIKMGSVIKSVRTVRSVLMGVREDAGRAALTVKQKRSFESALSAINRLEVALVGADPNSDDILAKAFGVTPTKKSRKQYIAEAQARIAAANAATK